METTEWEVELAEQYEHELIEDGAVIWGADEYIAVVDSDAPEYDGPYEVTPTSQEQTLDTNGMLMRDDVTVHQVPYYETTNESGGYTFSILS